MTSDERPPGAADTGDITDWLKQVRSADNVTLGKPPPPAPVRRSRWLWLACAVPLALAAAAFYVGATAGTGDSASRGQAVSGIVIGADGAPQAGALVFLERCPEVSGRTNADGAFVLKNAPPGSQTLVVVIHDVGQEFAIDVDRRGPTDVGALLYRAPPGR